MTNREEQVYEIIKENPLISQNEIADKLGMTRTAVSVYLDHLRKQGLLMGRGYILNQKKQPLVIGPGTVDIYNFIDLNSPHFSDESEFLVSDTRVVFGGAARNIVQGLISLSLHPFAILILADDNLGKAYINDCRSNGIDTTHFVINKERKSFVYNEYRTTSGTVLLTSYSGANVFQTETISPADLLPHTNIFNQCNLFILHDSLPVSVAAYIHSSVPNAQILIQGSSPEFISAYRDSLSLFNYGFFSIMSASSAATGEELSKCSHDELFTICKALINQGLQHFFMMYDKDTFIYCDKKQIVTAHSPISVDAPDNRFPYVFSICRDILTAVVADAEINDTPYHIVLEQLISARDIIAKSASNSLNISYSNFPSKEEILARVQHKNISITKTRFGPSK